MHQTDRGTYRKDESAFRKFRRSCLGKIVIALVVFILLLIVAWLTNPSDKKMREEMDDNIKQSIWSRDSITADGLDIFVSNVGHTFTHWNDSVTDDMKNRWRRFNDNNRKDYYDHTFFTTMYINCNFKGVTKRVGLGIFGLVIPLVDFNQFVPREGPMPDYQDPKLIQGTENEEYFGTTTVDVFRWEGE